MVSSCPISKTTSVGVGMLEGRGVAEKVGSGSTAGVSSIAGRDIAVGVADLDWNLLSDNESGSMQPAVIRMSERIKT